MLTELLPLILTELLLSMQLVLMLIGFLQNLLQQSSLLQRSLSCQNLLQESLLCQSLLCQSLLHQSRVITPCHPSRPPYRTGNTSSIQTSGRLGLSSSKLSHPPTARIP